eukprot:TRINITY_DN38366_c0_g1_i1.p1 TRINITY_DN38366_c0_g1~~TRINITY_DN38366_c0_g1_i1.p1  ORF type:complete len:295 (+),score=13.96 TRINITY_DN38366_c0_g1_i1:64-948(+)
MTTSQPSYAQMEMPEKHSVGTGVNKIYIAVAGTIIALQFIGIILLIALLVGVASAPAKMNDLLHDPETLLGVLRTTSRAAFLEVGIEETLRGGVPKSLALMLSYQYTPLLTSVNKALTTCTSELGSWVQDSANTHSDVDIIRKIYTYCSYGVAATSIGLHMSERMSTSIRPEDADAENALSKLVDFLKDEIIGLTDTADWKKAGTACIARVQAWRGTTENATMVLPTCVGVIGCNYGDTSECCTKPGWTDTSDGQAQRCCFASKNMDLGSSRTHDVVDTIEHVCQNIVDFSSRR